MNYITLIMVFLTVLPILFGALLGLLRGSRRAVLRLILIVVSVGLAFALTGVVTEAIMNMEISALGGSVIDYLKNLIINSLPESVAGSMSDYAVLVAQCLLQVIVFLLLFFIMWLLTWAIVYPLCKLFVRKGKRPHRIIGLVFGAVQGVVVALVVGVVMSGLLIQTGNVMSAMGDLNDMMGETTATQSASEEQAETSDGQSTEMLDKIVGMIGEYADSGIAKMYDKIGSKPFALISRVKVDDETTFTLPGQVEAVQGLVKMANELIDLKDMNFDKLFIGDNIKTLDKIFTELNNIKNGMSDEARTTVNKLLVTLSDDLGLADFTGIDLTKIDFKKEGEIFTRLEEYNKKDVSELTEEDAEKIINDLLQSDLILDMLQQQDEVDINSQFDKSEHGEKITEIINGLEVDEEKNITQEKIDALRQIFGMDKNTEATE